MKKSNEVSNPEIRLKGEGEIPFSGVYGRHSKNQQGTKDCDLCRRT
ncbi:MAG TPA: hypothetical protein VLW47_04270 [Thermodesulfobacteriota bacterium]|jgi:hypothetical protein|nr:hypothetical protein [Thermodesulfobacteriota bacterium]